MSDDLDEFDKAGGGEPEPKKRDNLDFQHSQIEFEPDWPVLSGGTVAPPADEVLARYRLTDLGNAKRFCARHGENVLFVSSMGWHVWDGLRWKDDGPDRPNVERLAWDTAQAIYKEAEADRKAVKEQTPDAGPLDERNDKVAQAVKARSGRLVKHAASSCTTAKMAAILKASQPFVVTKVDDLNRDPWRLAVANGTLVMDLEKARAGDDSCIRLEPHDRKDRITKTTKASYDERWLSEPFDGDEACPRWTAFLKQVFPDDEMRLYAQRIFGYILMGRNPERKIFVFMGQGTNGKGVLTRSFARALGDYAHEASMLMWLEQRNERPGEITTERQPLVGCRFAFSSEVKEGAAFNGALLKQVSGGDAMTVRGLLKAEVSFYPQFTLVLSVNIEPVIKGGDDAIWRRMAYVPFTQRFEGQEDDELETKLEAEADGILAWAVEGWRMWAEQGIAMPEPAQQALERWRANDDVLQDYLDAEVERDPDEHIVRSTFHKDFQAWQRLQGQDRVWTPQRIGKELEAKGIHHGQVREKGQCYQGIKFTLLKTMYADQKP